MERRLAAILAADIVGYTKLMQADEAGTLKRVRALWTELFDKEVGRHNGRVFKTMGDGALAEFSSATGAVECALAIQRAMQARNAESELPPIRFRMGVNLGDVVIDGDDVLGDGVIIAARLEPIAPAGGVLISDIVHSQVRGKVEASFESEGELTLKNLDSPVRAWRWEIGNARADRLAGRREQLSIAVLPFNNMSADPEQEFLADGISEDIITGLSKIRWFLVIARTSTFTYKGQKVDVAHVARELGVRYVLEGSVRKAGNRVRVTAQLIDATTSLHVWAEHYDRDLEDIFELQDEITRTIVGRVEPEISAAERDRALRHRTENIDAWECYQRGLWHMWVYGVEDHKKAIELLTKATELDSSFSTAFAYLCYAYYEGVIMGWADDPDHDIALGLAAARQALRLDNKDPVGHFSIGRIYMMRGEQDASIDALETAISINPSFSQAYHGLSMILALVERFEESRAAAEQVERLSPRDPILWATLVTQGLAEIMQNKPEAALDWVRRTEQTQRATGYWPHAIRAAAYAQMGRMDEARTCLVDAISELPSLSASYLKKSLPVQRAGALDPYLDALRAVGLPE